ncbi:MAG: 4-hydroxythreonine-4-phosphate dehydrogenase PdxA [Proteobacteria bacterium]|nr:4-hydroxythreonine-4-phosphate dehydrogenase PdxA [Pseudomonadota bacterium]
MSDLPPVALTMGEPAGIGGELTIAVWRRRQELTTPFFVIDDPERLSEISRQFGSAIEIEVISDPSEAARTFQNALPVLALTDRVCSTPGHPIESTAMMVLQSIERAVDYARSGAASAVVTNPIQKDVLYRSGFKFPGHTEYLAALTATETPPVMMLASPMLRVVPVSVHTSLRRAISELTTTAIVTHARIAIRGLVEDFGVARPRVAVAGLNPHAGEAGTLGDEDRTIIAPAVEILQVEAADVFGPVPPDALFTARARAGFDVAICMYHDQALIPIKALDVDNAVNVTLGLPIVRTSPDHGTALDIAGRGVADPTSLIQALKMADAMARCRLRAGGLA